MWALLRSIGARRLPRIFASFMIAIASGRSASSPAASAHSKRPRSHAGAGRRSGGRGWRQPSCSAASASGCQWRPDLGSPGTRSPGMHLSSPAPTSDLTGRCQRRTLRSDSTRLFLVSRLTRRAPGLRATARTPSASARPSTRARRAVEPAAQPAAPAAGVRGARSALTGEWIDAAIVLAIVVASAASATRASTARRPRRRELRARRARARAGAARRRSALPCRSKRSCPATSCCCRPAAWCPRDGVVLEATDCFVSEAVLTGESFPVEKQPGASPPTPPLARRDELRLPRHQRAQRHGRVRWSSRPAPRTEFGAIAAPAGAAPAGDRVRPRHPPVRLPAHERHAGDGAASCSPRTCSADARRSRRCCSPSRSPSGLSPELLPAILSVNLARGAQTHGAARRARPPAERDREPRQHGRPVHRQDRHADRGRRSQLEGAYDAPAPPPPACCELAAVNAALETGIANPLDDAILARAAPDARRASRSSARSRSTSCASA